jgi:hypothetical protein
VRATKARLPALALLVALTALSLSSAAGTRAKQARLETGEGAARRVALHAYRSLPLAFVRNADQLDSRVRYSAQAGSAGIFLTRREAVLALAKGKQGVALRLAFLGASARATVSGTRRSPGGVSYLVGNDPAGWKRSLPTYKEVAYRDLWPGIDMAVRGGGGALKYEFRLAPGADPARIRLAYRGQERLSLGRGGALRIETALGLLRDTRPLSYQLIGGRRVAVASRFVLGRGGADGFAIGAYDRRYPLVIDPGLRYSTYLGGSERDDAFGIAVDGAGSAYVSGVTWSRNFPTTAGAFDRSHNGGSEEVAADDAFVTKLNAAGSALVYSTYLGGSGDDRWSRVAVDGEGSAYVTGVTDSTNFPTTGGAFDRSYNGPYGDAFVTKLNAAGSSLVYSTYLGPSGADDAFEIAVDGAGSAYVSGVTDSTDFPTTAGAFDRSHGGKYDAFVTKLNAAGSALAYSTYLGGSSFDISDAIALDGAGSAYLTGRTVSSNFPTTAGAFDRSYNGGKYGDAFVTKLNAAGSALAYSSFLGGSSLDEGSGIAVDGAGSAYVSGVTDSTDFPTTAGAFDRSHGGKYGDAFVTKLNAAGSALAYSTYLGGSGGDGGGGIALDAAGSAYVAGGTESTDFPTTAGAFDRSYNGRSYHGRSVGGDDAFVAKLNAAGSGLRYSTFLGGIDIDGGGGIALDAAGSAYVAGGTWSRNFPTTAGAFDKSSDDDDNAFVTKLDLVAGRVRCDVPRVVGMTLLKAKRTIRAMDCSVGRIRRARSRRVGRVLSQSPRAGTVRKRGFRVNLVVGRR